MTTPAEFMERVIVERGEDGMYLLVDDEVVTHSTEPADLRRALCQRFCKEPRWTRDGARQLNNYKSAYLPARTTRKLLNKLDKMIYAHSDTA